MKCIYSEVLGSEPNPAAPFGLVVRAIILADEAPESLEIDGSDVDGLSDSDIIAAGSILITPDTNYIAFEDGVFMAKGGSGGGGDSVFKVTIGYDGAQEQYTCDKTYAQIAAAYEAGKFIYGVDNLGMQLSFVMLRDIEGSKFAILTEPASISQSGVSAGLYTIQEDGSVQYTLTTYSAA